MALFGAFVALARVPVTLDNFVGELLKMAGLSHMESASNNEKAYT